MLFIIIIIIIVIIIIIIIIIMQVLGDPTVEVFASRDVDSFLLPRCEMVNLRIAHFRITYKVGNPGVGNPEVGKSLSVTMLPSGKMLQLGSGLRTQRSRY